MKHSDEKIDDFTITLVRKKIKNINLRISLSGEVKVSAPLRLPLPQIHRFLEEKREWIDHHRRRIKARQPQHPLTLTTGDCLYFLGDPYEWIVYEQEKYPRIEIDNTRMHCFIKANASFAEKNELLQRWYRNQMANLLPELIQKWEAIVGVKINAFGIRAMKTRWGSCNILKKRIWLNLNLIEKPLGCLESVIVHELVHLLEASHNKRFYALMSQFMPNWKQHQQSLRNSPIGQREDGSPPTRG